MKKTQKELYEESKKREFIKVQKKAREVLALVGHDIKFVPEKGKEENDEK